MSDDETAAAVILDVMPHGRSDDDRPGYQKEPVAYAIGTDDFQLYELIFSAAPDLTIGDRVQLKPRPELDDLADLDRIDYEGLSSGAQTELEYVVEEIIDDHVGRFVGFFNDAQPISLRMHQLDLLPGIGNKLRDNILDARKREPFDDFDELEERVDGLHSPREILIERIMQELTEDDLKYHLFVGPNALLAQS